MVYIMCHTVTYYSPLKVRHLVWCILVGDSFILQYSGTVVCERYSLRTVIYPLRMTTKNP